MSVGPVNTSLAGIGDQAPEKAHAASTAPGATSGTAPKVELASEQNAPAPLLIPEHEVKVQLDTGNDEIIVYQVLDKQSGALVLQVPSAAQLRGIHQTQELLREIASRGKISTSDGGSAQVVEREENNNGSKL